MSGAGVPPNKMDGPYELDDASIEALLAGDGYAVDPLLADVLGDLRVASTARMPRVGADLAALLGAPASNASNATATPSLCSTQARIRSRLAKIGAAAAAAIVAATGGLAVAGALPPPIQNALSHVGLPSPSAGPPHHHRVDTTPSTQPSTAADPTTTTAIDPPAAAGPADHGRAVSGVAHNQADRGCGHGHDVAAAAADRKSNGQPCRKTSTGIASHAPPNNTPHNNATHNTPRNSDSDIPHRNQPGSQHNSSGGPGRGS